MRLVQIWVPAEKRSVVAETLDKADVEYVTTAATNEHDVVFSVPLPTPAVEPILEELRSVGVDESTYTIVLEAETVISSKFEALEEEYLDSEETEGGITSDIRIAREELETRSKDLVLALPSYLVLTVVSAVIATAGLLLDSPATVVGSMVIAPLIGPSMAASVGTVLDNRELFVRGVKMQLLGILVSILGALIFGLAVRYLHLVPPGIEVLALDEVSERAEPSVLVLAIALGAGVAGIISLMTGVSTALVGVMIAVALIPPAAAVGVGLAFGIPRLAIGASVMVTVNALSINLASLSMLWLEGYRPEAWFQTRSVEVKLVKQIAVLLFAIGLVSVFLLGVTYDSYVASTTEEDIRTAIVDELEQVDLDLEIRAVRIDRGGILPPLETERVVVSLSVEHDAPIPPLAERITNRIEEITDGPVVVEIEFIRVQRAG